MRYLLKKSLQINRQYAENMENFSHSLNTLIQNNQEEIEKDKKIKYQKNT